MSLTTTNKYGKISISDEAVAAVASQVASECYGVVEMVSRRFSDNIATLWGRNKLGKGVKVATVDNLVYIEVFVILKVGVNIETVRKATADTVTFAAAMFTGLRAKQVHRHVVGIRV